MYRSLRIVLILLFHYGRLLHQSGLGSNHNAHCLLMLAQDRLHLFGVRTHTLCQEFLLHLTQLVHVLLGGHHLLHGKIRHKLL